MFHYRNEIIMLGMVPAHRLPEPEDLWAELLDELEPRFRMHVADSTPMMSLCLI